MLFELTHETVFAYTDAVSEAYMEFRLTPVTDGSQHLLQHRRRVAPSLPVRHYVDAYGNTVSYFSLLEPHDKIEVGFDSVVETHAASFGQQALAGQDLHSPAVRLALYDYQCPTPLTAPCPELRDFVEPLIELRQAPAQQAADVVSETIHSRFRYEGGVTNASSPITDILRHGGGVCQDFAHLMLATCRNLGFAARYVSGYVFLETDGGTAASHAWCEVFDPEHGWFGVDPTHNQRTGERYVRLGTGRDFNDVPPNRGVFRGRASEEMRLHVTLRPITRDELGQKARALYPELRTLRSYDGTRRGKPQPLSILEQSLSAQQQQQQQ